MSATTETKAKATKTAGTKKQFEEAKAEQLHAEYLGDNMYTPLSDFAIQACVAAAYNFMLVGLFSYAATTLMALTSSILLSLCIVAVLFGACYYVACLTTASVVHYTCNVMPRHAEIATNFVVDKAKAAAGYAKDAFGATKSWVTSQPVAE